MGTARHTVVLRYHEVALKGRNRPFFVRRLADHVEAVLAGLPVGRVRRASARLVVPLADVAAWPAIRARPARVFGVANFALAEELAVAAPGGDPGVVVARLDHAVRGRPPGPPIASL